MGRGPLIRAISIGISTCRGRWSSQRSLRGIAMTSCEAAESASGEGEITVVTFELETS
jgi:hypothetical protein